MDTFFIANLAAPYQIIAQVPSSAVLVYTSVVNARNNLIQSGQLSPEFLKSGGIFQWEDRVHCFWGAPSRQPIRPKGPSLYSPDFFLEDDKPWWTFENYESFATKDFQNILRMSIEQGLAAGTVSPMLMSWVKPKKEEFSLQFELVQTWIAEKQVEKAVPFVFSKGKWPGTSEELLLHSLHFGCEAQGGQLYGLWHGETWMLGRSPETLIEQKEEVKWSTMALAGTTTWERYESHPQEFLQDPKESREQQLVVEFLKEKLKPLGTFVLQPRSVFRAGSLAHLRTTVELETSPGSVSLEKMIETLHPTPALGCYPADDWRTRLCSLGWRGRYGAPFGLSLSSAQAQVIVAIRNLQKHEGAFVLGTGCGVIQASDREKEWAELDIKRKSVLGIFNL